MAVKAELSPSQAANGRKRLFMITVRSCAIALFICVAGCWALHAQSAQPTNNILFNTLMIKCGGEAGTMFSVDVDNRQYWLTAKHILTGRTSGPAGEFSQKTVWLQVLEPVGNEIKWNSTQFDVIDPGKDIDIVALVPTTKLQASDMPALKLSSANFGIGAECSFLGFPYANTWTATLSTSAGLISYKMPFIKHCYISGIIQPLGVLVLDGINNPGFSGGPVLYNTGPSQVVIGVISGYHVEPGEVHSVELPDTSTAVGTKKKKEDVVDLNSGIILAYSTNAAVDAIRKNPIGRPVEPK